jgi:uncharacterized protein
MARERTPAPIPAYSESQPAGARLRVLVSGASGMIGTELCTQLEANGHTVLRLVRRPPKAPTEFRWSPNSRTIDVDLMDHVDAVVNLSGASLSRLPWTARYKRTILDSRVRTTQVLTDAMRVAERAPATFLNASAVGVYGDQPDVFITEDSPVGHSYLARVVRAWEAAAHLAPSSTRVVTLRSGLVLARAGALRPLMMMARLGLSGPIGTGRQYWPWISLYDEAAAIRHLLTSAVSGPVNLVGPTPATADEVVRTVAARLHRPYGLRLPKRLIEATLADAGRELLLSSQKVSPTRLQADGFVFRHRSVDQAVEWLLAR